MFQWRRQYEARDLAAPSCDGPKLLPVIASDPEQQAQKQDPAVSRCAPIHIELPRRALISIEAGIDPALAAAVVERFARGIELPRGTRIWIVAGVTDPRRGFDRLSAQHAVQDPRTVRRDHPDRYARSSTTLTWSNLLIVISLV